MEFILEDIAAKTKPRDEELLAYMKKNPDAYQVDPQIGTQDSSSYCHEAYGKPPARTGRSSGVCETGLDD